MIYDPTWSQPLVNWQQQGSFVGPATPPSAGPLDGTLVQLPCINIDWLPLVLGALDQLRNPSSWLPSLTDAQLYDVLGDADTLRSAIGQALTAASPCVNPLVDLTFASCTFTKHFADGSTGAIVDWADAFCSCALACATPVPPPVGEMPGAQRACNIAGYLATAVIQGSMQAVHDALAADQTVVEYAQAASQAFAAILPLTYYAVQAFVDWYHTAAGELLSDVADVAADESLWSQVTCVIFSAIDTVGYVDASNFSAVASGLAAISYPKAWVPGDLSTFWTNIGLNNWQNAQDVGAVDDVDCTGCTTTLWCKYFNFATSAAGWELYPPEPVGVYTDGVGWQGALDPSDSRWSFLGISIDLPFVATITEVQFQYSQNHDNHSPANQEIDLILLPSTVVATVDFSLTPIFPGSAWASFPIAGNATRIVIFLAMDSGDDPQDLIIHAAQVRGTGVCPFDLPNDCIVGP